MGAGDGQGRARVVLGGVIEMVAMFDSPEPIGTSSSLLFFVVAASYFLSVRATLAFWPISCPRMRSSRNSPPAPRKVSRPTVGL